LNVAIKINELVFEEEGKNDVLAEKVVLSCYN
jgi:hypothetical protein